MIQYKDLKTGQLELLPENYNNQKCMTFDFIDNQKTGTMSGQTITNSVQCDYNLYDNNEIVVTNFGGTKVGEFNVFGSKFWRTIRLSTHYKINNDTLIINYDNDTKCMIFIKQAIRGTL